MKINFEKVRNYNQLILAIGITVGLIMLLFGAAAFIYEATYWLRNNNDNHSGISVEEPPPQTNRDTIPKQLVSFQNITLVDSASQIFLLPVTQADLVDYTNHSDIYRFSGSYKYGKDRVFNNLLLYDANNETSEILFNSRICITKYFTIKSKNEEPLIFIMASSRDSNQDKYLNDEDLQELYFYDVKNRNLRKIEIGKNQTVLDIYKIPKTEIIVGKFGVDKNQNGEFDWRAEAVNFQKFDVKNGQLVEIASKNQMESLQNLLEGM